MWPIPVLKHKFVSVSFFPDALVCCWIESAKASADKLLVLRAYKRYPLDNLELEFLTPFNPTAIKKYIGSFLRQYDLCDAFVTFSLHGSAVTEQFIAMPTSTPHRTDFGMSGTQSMLWEYRYVYPNHDGQFMFYLYTVPRSLILQYQLLAMSVRCNLITMTTHTACLLSAYQHMFGNAFRRSQLAVDMMRHHNNVDNLISVDAVNRMVINAADINVMQERPYLAAAVGLLCSERIC